MTGRRHRARRWVLVLLVPVLLGLLARPAEGHVWLDLVSPRDGGRVETAPAAIRLLATEPLEPGSVQVVVTGQRTGTEVRLGPMTAGEMPEEAVFDVRSEMPDDAYLVSAQVTGLDGHTVGSTWAFVVGSGPAVSVTRGVTGDDPRAQAVLYAARVTVTLATALLALPLVLLLLHRPGLTSRRLRRAFGLGVAATLVGSLVEAGLTGTTLAAGDSGLLRGLALMWGLPVGKLLVLRCLAVAALVVAHAGLTRDARSGRWSPTRANVAILGFGGLVLTHAASSHAADDASGMLAIVAASAHLAAVSLWLAAILTWWGCGTEPGGARGTAGDPGRDAAVPTVALPDLARWLEPAQPAPTVQTGQTARVTQPASTLLAAAPQVAGRQALALTATAVDRTVRLARVTAAVAFGTGLFLTWRFTAGFDLDGLADGYAAVLALKGLAVALLIRRARHSHRLCTDPEASPRDLRRALGEELAVGGLVLLVGGVLAEIG